MRLSKTFYIAMILGLAISFLSDAYSKENYDEQYNQDINDIYYLYWDQSEEKITNKKVIEWIIGTGAGYAIGEAIKRFERDHHKLTDDWKAMFERVHREARDARERAETRARERERERSEERHRDTRDYIPTTGDREAWA